MTRLPVAVATAVAALAALAVTLLPTAATTLADPTRATPATISVPLDANEFQWG
ncbi:hypothetical protein ACFV0O_27275 [Kitasatospora sp. NPDC059577]|uniref:hypothetical protein n=1 Tax=Kitasatospora sp. NPDC059577 TaxID=3346873 RepID=UPI0036996912